MYITENKTVPGVVNILNNINENSIYQNRRIFLGSIIIIKVIIVGVFLFTIVITIALYSQSARYKETNLTRTEQESLKTEKSFAL